MKHCKKTIALLLSILMTLSMFSVIGFAQGGDEGDEGDEGEPATYTVTFYKDASSVDLITGDELAAVLDTQTVTAGQDATDPLKGEDGKYPSDIELKASEQLNYPDESEESFTVQHFLGWNQTLTNVQSNLYVYPQFGQIGKRYNIHYYDYSGKTPYHVEGCTYGQQLKQIPVAEWNIDPLKYRYEFVGWALKPNINPDDEAEAKYLLVWPDNQLVLPTDDDLGQYKEQPDYIDVYGRNVPYGEEIDINVYACFRRFDKEYKLSLTVLDQYGYSVPNADVQIKGDNGLLLDQTFGQRDPDGNLTNRPEPAAGKTDANGRLSMRLPYQDNYYISATYYGSDSSGKATKTVSVSQMQNLETNNTIGVTITLQKVTERCNCICHSFLGGFWVRILNLLYDFLKVKYVCCDDMYATHRGQLAYSA